MPEHMAPGANGRHEKATSSTSAVDEEHQAVEKTNNENKSPRHPRWTKQETLILIEGKKTAESQGRKGRRSSSSVFGTGQLEPKWDYVSSYCRSRGVNRGPVQCRKRWSNLVSDFKKIKAWESQEKDEGQSFWMIRNDFKREKKLPGHFDREVYAVLDGKAHTAPAYQLAAITVNADGKETDGICATDTEDDDENEDDEEEENTETVFDSLISDPEQCATKERILKGREVKVARESPRNISPAPMPLSEKKYQQFHQAYSNQGPAKGKQPGSHFGRRNVFQDGAKRRLLLDGCDDINLSHYLIKVLERNTNILNAQLEAQRMNFELEREQQKDCSNTLSSTLDKISDALTKIADKL
ncbi:hypothetical protein ACH5RR_008396 [Cinchona calisaya]|uniref:Myb-like domain-containing protein n=1 Tax=Cinchona calisaya TaxID=153742 RepID=A0ABD3ABM4_9GENT